MRKLVKAGLTVPTVLLAAMAVCGLAMAADEAGQDLNDRAANKRTADGYRARPADRDLSDTTQVMGSTEGSDSIVTPSRDGRSSAAVDARSDRRGRQAPRRTEAGAVIDEEAWWWWWNHGGGFGGDDENSDEDDDEDQSPSSP